MVVITALVTVSLEVPQSPTTAARNLSLSVGGQASLSPNEFVVMQPSLSGLRARGFVSYVDPAGNPAIDDGSLTLGDFTAGAQSYIGARMGTVFIPGGSNIVQVVFSTPWVDSTYVPHFVFSNVVDVPPIMLQGVISAKTAGGFTVTMNAPTDSPNYEMHYSAGGAK